MKGWQSVWETYRTYKPNLNVSLTADLTKKRALHSRKSC